jgi:xanthine phosphoribosyltransferase
MEILKKRILADGLAIGTEILKVDSFLNHQVDVQLLEQIGEEFRLRFADVADKVDKILTVEASGIAVACFVARHFANEQTGKYPPVVFAKKGKPNTMTDDAFSADIYSFTKDVYTTIRIAKKYLSEGERVIVIDDFLAHGLAAAGLVEIVNAAGATTLGVGAVVEKAFQGGAQRLEEDGLRVESLVVVEKIQDGVIEFRE